MVDDIEIQDNIETENNQILSLKEIILRQIRKIGDISSREFTGGFWEERPVKTGDGILFTKTWHDDVRESYCNAVDFLIDLIYPIGDDEFKKYLREFEGFKEKIKDKKKDLEPPEKIDPNKKLYLKRQTFRQINLMFDRINFFSESGGYFE